MSLPAVGANLLITPAEELVFQAMATDPLEAALLNINWLWLYHRPRMAASCPTQPSGLNRNSVTVIPIAPSQDAIKYDFRTTVLTSANTNINVQVDYCTAYTGRAGTGTPTTWTNIFTQATATTLGVRQVQTKTGQTVPRTAIALRVTVWADAGTYELHHILATPGETSLPTGVQNSGFAPYDDGILSLTAAPVHTELLNRCRRSATALLIDRKQMVFSLTQDEALGNVRATETDKPTFQTFPPIRVRFPNQGNPTVTVYSLASVDAGSGTGVVRLSQVGSAVVTAPGSVLLDASTVGQLDSDTLTLQTEGDGLGCYADLQAAIKTTAGNTTYLHALVCVWTPGA